MHTHVFTVGGNEYRVHHNSDFSGTAFVTRPTEAPADHRGAEIPGWLARVLVEIQAAPTGASVAGLAKIEDRIRVNEAALFHDRAQGLVEAARLIRSTLAAPSPVDAVVAEVLAVDATRFLPLAGCTHLEAIEETAAQCGAGESFDDLPTDRDCLKMIAAVAIAGVLACDAKGGA